MRRTINGHTLDTKRADLLVHLPAVKLQWKAYWELEEWYYVTKRDKLLFYVVNSSDGNQVIGLTTEKLMDNAMFEHGFSLEKRQSVIQKYHKLKEA